VVLLNHPMLKLDHPDAVFAGGGSQGMAVIGIDEEQSPGSQALEKKGIQDFLPIKPGEDAPDGEVRRPSRGPITWKGAAYRWLGTRAFRLRVR
jgi:hypothetical protein